MIFNQSNTSEGESEQQSNDQLIDQVGELTTSAIYYTASRPSSRTHSVRSIVLHRNQSISGPFSCIRRLFGSFQEERQPLIPVHTISGSSGSVGGGTISIGVGIGGVILQFLENWLFRSIRNSYSSNYAYITASIATVLLISVILGLYYTGNLELLLLLCRTLLCQLIQSLNVTTLPSFCTK